MSKFEKIIIPLIDKCILPIDLTKLAGFIGSYTYDPDKPSGDKEFFLMYDDSIRNKYTIDRARRFELSKMVKRKYIKYIDGKPCYIYSFWVKPELKKMYNGMFTLSTSQKISVLQFWSEFDPIVDYIMSNTILSVSVTHDMPLEDYRESISDDIGFMITKKGQPHKEVVPYFFIIYR